MEWPFIAEHYGLYSFVNQGVTGTGYLIFMYDRQYINHAFDPTRSRCSSERLGMPRVALLLRCVDELPLR